MLVTFDNSHDVHLVNLNTVSRVTRGPSENDVLTLTFHFSAGSPLAGRLSRVQAEIILHRFDVFLTTSIPVREDAVSIFSHATETDSGGGTSDRSELKQQNVSCLLSATTLSFLAAALTKPLQIGDRVVTAAGERSIVTAVSDIPARSGVPARTEAAITSVTELNSRSLFRRAG